MSTTSGSQTPPLHIVSVIPPEPRHRPGTYEVCLELSRPLTGHERRALRHPNWRMQVVGRELTLIDTTLERVAQAAPELACLIQEVELEGRRRDDEDQRRALTFAAEVDQERARLAALARSIRFSPASHASAS